MTSSKHDALPIPRNEAHSGTLPSALTFFVSRAQRAAILRALKQLSDDRSRALLIALGEIEPGHPDRWGVES